MRFGSHVSIREGYLGAAKHAHSINASAFQYFPSNPRSLTIKDFSESDAEQCKQYCREMDIVSVSHSPYPTNITPTKEKKQKVVDSLLNDLAITDACGSVGIVVHFGKQISKKDPLASYQLMIEMLNNILSKWDGDCKILLENTAGKPGSIGTTLEELVKIRDLCDYPEKMGYCLDTCHAFASGVWNGDNWYEVMKKGESLSFFEYLEVIHLNNSMYPTESGKDRHANIFNHGHIKENQWNDLITTPTLQRIPLILETPEEYGVAHNEEINQLEEKWGN